MILRGKKVAIIGGGVNGLYLAWKLSQKGNDVSVFEQKKELGGKVCSALISERIKNFLPVGDDLIERKIETFTIHFPKKDIVLELNPVHFVINRQKLVEKLADLAKRAGAKILLGKQITRLPYGFDSVIGCDGSMSFVRKTLKIKPPKMQSGIQGFLEKENKSNNVDVWQTKNGFFWQIPRGKNIEYGLMASPQNFSQEFNEAIHKFPKLKQREIEKVLENKKSALIPCPRTNIFDILRGEGLALPKRKSIVTLCGDAVGLTKPWSGGGVIWGLTAADILVKNFPDLSAYQKELKKFFFFKILKGRVITFSAHFLGRYFPYVIPSRIVRDNDFPFV